MKSRKLLITAGITITALLIIQYMIEKKKKEKKRIHISNEGYETAEDILYPGRKYARLS
jgi:hypothetical protein